MSITGRAYNIKACTLLIGGVPIGGFGEDGGVVHEWVADMSEVTVGADGEAAVSRINNDDMMVTVKLLSTTLGYKRLAGIVTKPSIKAFPKR